VRWTISQNRDSNVETAVSFTDEDATLIVDARGSNGTYLNNLEMEANVISPQGETVNLTLQQVAPGRYEAIFTPEEDGAYFIRVAGTAPDEEDDIVIGQTSGWVLGYSPEYQQIEADTHLLTTIAELTNGRDLSTLPEGEEVAAIIAHDLPTDRATRPIWPWLTLLAVVLLPIDIAIRRLVITRRDMERAYAATFGRFTPEVMIPADRTEQVARLFQAKKRAGMEKGEDAAVVEPSPVQRRDAAEQQPSTPRPVPSTPHQPLSTPPASGSALASRLLEKKRQQAEERKDDS
jgi:hypothetical protein